MLLNCSRNVSPKNLLFLLFMAYLIFCPSLFILILFARDYDGNDSGEPDEWCDDPVGVHGCVPLFI
jgi:hypothetical protein